MAQVKPIVIYSGLLSQLIAGDYVAPTALGSGTPDGTKFLRGDGTWVTPTASAAPAGNTKEVQYNNAGSTAGAANVEIDNGDLVLGVNSSPVTPPASFLKVLANTWATKEQISIISSSGTAIIPADAFYNKRNASWNPPGSTTTVGAINGINTFSSQGTATARSTTSTNIFSRSRRLGYLSLATAGSLCGQYVGAGMQYSTGNGSGLGGFLYNCRFGFSDPAAVAGVRAFIGLLGNAVAPTNIEPSTQVQFIGMAQLSTDATQMYIVYGGSAAQTSIALGTNFPPMNGIGAELGAMYDFTLYANPNLNGVIGYKVVRVGTAFVAEGTITPTVVGTQTPSSTTFLNHRAWRCNNATALSCAIDICRVYFESDN